MDLKKLLGLRPKRRTVSDIREAIGRVEEQRAATTARINGLLASRGATLLTADAAGVQKAEAALAEAREEAERLVAFEEAMQGELVAAEREETARRIAELVAEAQQETEAFVSFWRSTYPALAQQIGEGMAHLTRATNVRTEANALANRYPDAFEASGVTFPPSIGSLLYGGQRVGDMASYTEQVPPYNSVYLPSAEGLPPPHSQHKAFWPPALMTAAAPQQPAVEAPTGMEG